MLRPQTCIVCAGCWARLAFLGAREKKALVVVVAKIEAGLSIELLPAAYIARHRVNENHNDPLTPGALSRWLLWGESRSLARNTAAFRRRFRLQ